MKITEIRSVIREVIAEAREEGKLPKSSGKLMDLKKELEALKKMKDELQTAKFTEKTAETEVEFANLQKFAKELDKIKQGGVTLEANIDSKIKEITDRISGEKHKIKEMIGLIKPAEKKKGIKKIEDVKKPKAADKELDEAKKKAPSTGLTKKTKSSIVKKARAGKDIGKKGKGFEKVEKAAEKEYGSKEAGKKVAAAAMWKQQAKK